MAGSGTAHLRSPDETLLRVENLVVEFPVGRSGLKVNAVSNVSLDVKQGETLGLVGESGCGKSTTGKAIMQLPRPKSGKVLFEGADMTDLSGAELRKTRTRMKMIFQDPISSLNPRRKVEDIIAEGLRIWKMGTDEEQAAKIDEAMLAVGLDPSLQRGRRPHQFSGGQCQRISIARAVVTDPKLIICDEPEGLPLLHVEADVRHRVHLEPAASGLELHHEVLDPQQRLFRRTEMCGTRTRHQATTEVGATTDPPALTGRPAAVTPAATLVANAAFPASVPTG